MALPSFVQASAGQVITTGAATVSLTGCIAGNVVFLVWYEDGSGNDSSIGTHVNTEKIDGTDSDLEFFQNIGTGGVGNLHAFAGRVMANGTISANLTVGGSGTDLFAVWYEFTDVATTVAAANTEAISEDALPSLDYYGFASGTSASVTHPSITSTGDDRLVVAFIGVNANQALTAFTGATGGTWSEPVAEFASASGTAATVGIQTAELPLTGTISGGSIAITSASWGVLAFALKPASEQMGYQRLYGPEQLGTVAADLYTAPDDSIVEIRRIWINNPSGGTVKPTLSIGADAASTRVLELEDIVAGEAYDGRRGANHTLVAGETIQGYFTLGDLAVLDDFNRADESPATGWTELAATGAFDIVSNQAAGPGRATYDGIPISTDVTVSVVLTGDVPVQIGVGARLTNTGTSNGTGYFLQYSNSEGPGMGFQRQDGASVTNFGGGGSPLLGAGDKIALRCIGTRLEAWIYSGGVWSLMYTETDATYASGLVGLLLESGEELDDFAAATAGDAVITIDGYVKAV